MKSKPKRSTLNVHVPDDVILNHMLPRVPTKFVCRFNCVSKEWRSFLTSDMFQNKHNRHVDDHKNNLKYLFLSKTETSFEFSTIDYEEAPPSDKGLTPTRRPLPQFGDTTYHDIRILTSFHGLVCLGIIIYTGDPQYYDLILWNPLTNEYKRLSKSNYFHRGFHTCYSIFGLYYSCCEDDYKLLVLDIWDKDVHIYSLKSDSWRKVVDAFQHISMHYHGRWSRQGTYLNENLYFLQQNSYRWPSSIIRFDTKTERLSQINTPDSIHNYIATIMVRNDCLHVCVKYDIEISCDKGLEKTTCIKLWKLDEYENMKEVVTYQLRPLVYGISLCYLVPFHLMKNGIWLMRKISPPHGHTFLQVDLKKKHYFKHKGIIYDDFEYAEVRVDGHNNEKNIVDDEVRYIETFVSPNRYMK